MKPFLKLAERCGHRKAWERGAVVGDHDSGVRVPVLLAMSESGRERIVAGKVVDDRERTGTVYAVDIVGGQPQKGEALWSGPVGLDAPPLRAMCVACGLVDSDGQPVPLPSWVPQG